MDGSLHAVQAGQVVPGGLTLAPPNSTFEMSPCREEEAEKLPNRENHSGRVGLYSEALYVWTYDTRIETFNLSILVLINQSNQSR